MKKIILVTLLIATTVSLSAVDDDYAIGIGSWNLRIFTLDHLYRGYLADPLGVRLEAAVQTMLYSAYDHTDSVNDGGSYTGHLSIFPGVRMSFIQFTNADRTMGFEGEIGLMTPVHMRSTTNDVIGVDGIYYFRINAMFQPWLTMNFSKHHICTHIGDEFDDEGVQSPSNYDPNIGQLPVYDDFRVAVTVRPLYFLKNPQWDILAVYAELGFFAPGSDFLGGRGLVPESEAYMNYQAGIELEYYFPGKLRHIGGLFAAANWSAYQQNGYSPNLSVNAGWILPQDRNARRMRIGFQYYNGRSLINQFYNYREKFWAVYLAADI